MTNPIFKFAIREDLSDTGDLFLPKKAEPYATGYDVYFAPKDRKDLVVHPGEYVKLPLGFRSFCPSGWYYELHPRSSTFIKKNLHVLIGIIDETWEGQTALVGMYLPEHDNSLAIKFGEPIGQIIPRKKQDIIAIEINNNDFDSLCKERNSIRGTGGFGSSKDVNFVIYKIINKINNKIYIGQTTRTLNERITSYKYEKSNRPIINALKKYGMNSFQFEIIDKAFSVDELNLLEEEWIEKLNTRNLNIGYNLRAGGTNSFYGKNHNNKTKEKLSKQRSGSNNWWRGRKHSAETKKKMSAAQKGRNVSKETRIKSSLSQRKIKNHQIDNIKILRNEGHSYSYIAKLYKVSRETIRRAIKKYG